jgi:glycosyltransferase involved in cell wall biosynthesis
MSNPFVSKLAGMATQVVRAYGCDVVVGSYFEPYGVAASLAASWTNTPVVLQHAGSDLDRLMRLPELGAVYREILRSADRVVTHEQLYGRFVGLGVDERRLGANPPYAIPAVFGPETAPWTPAEIAELAVRAPDRPFDPALPTIGMYGKPGVFKGTFDLVAALAALAADGLDFNVLFLSGESRLDDLAEAVDAGGLGERTWFFPFVAHWRVASFIRTCTAVCFLERDFPVVLHGPAIPREILSTGPRGPGKTAADRHRTARHRGRDRCSWRGAVRRVRPVR